MRFLVLTYCQFESNELQRLLANVQNLEHVSLRFVQWEGSINFGKSLLSLGFFPEREFSGCYSIQNCSKLWQVSTRFNENNCAAADFLNKCSKLESIHRIKFEAIREERVYEMNDFLSSSLNKWEERKEHKLDIVMNEDEYNQYSVIKEIIGVEEENILSWEDVHFEDCPLWSDESKEFIHMTNKRKLLLR